MSWVRLGQDLNITLGLVLIIRLLVLRLERVYRVFCLFLMAEFLASLLAFLDALSPNSFPDYRIMWMASRTVIWIFTLWTVYSLLNAVLLRLPGILKFSRKVLNSAFVAAIILGILSIRPEYSASGFSGYNDPVARILGLWIVLDRVVCTVALLVLLSILAFVLWFPVEVSRNLIVFATGFLVYFAAKTALWLTRSFWSHESLNLVSNLNMFIASGCFAYWAVFINRAGATVPVTIGHTWRPREQERLIGQLEAMNAALLGATARR